MTPEQQLRTRVTKRRGRQFSLAMGLTAAIAVAPFTIACEGNGTSNNTTTTTTTTTSAETTTVVVPTPSVPDTITIQPPGTVTAPPGTVTIEPPGGPNPGGDGPGRGNGPG
jgi:hypothetical protein